MTTLCELTEGQLSQAVGGRTRDTYGEDYGWCTYNARRDYMYQGGQDYGVAGELAGFWIGGAKAAAWDCL
jgi:hypothetical protein